MSQQYQTYVVVIDSRLRDTELFPYAHTYVVEFPHIFKNIVSVDLVYALYGRNNLSAADTYVNLRIDELSPNLISNNTVLTGAFTQLPFTTTDPMSYSPATHFRSWRLFDTPLSKLGKMSIAFVSSIGTPFDITEHFLRFEIKCIKQDTPLMASPNSSLNIVSLRSDMDYFDLSPNFKIQDLIDAYKRKCAVFQIRKAPLQEREYAKNAFKTLARSFKA